jgi:hypothetical protein
MKISPVLLIKNAILTVIHTAMIILGFQYLVRGLVIGFVINGSAQYRQAASIEFGYLTLLPLAILGLFFRRIAGIALVACSLISYTVLFTLPDQIASRFQRAFVPDVLSWPILSGVTLVLISYLSRERSSAKRIRDWVERSKFTRTM